MKKRGKYNITSTDHPDGIYTHNDKGELILNKWMEFDESKDNEIWVTKKQDYDDETEYQDINMILVSHQKEEVIHLLIPVDDAIGNIDYLKGRVVFSERWATDPELWEVDDSKHTEFVTHMMKYFDERRTHIESILFGT